MDRIEQLETEYRQLREDYESLRARIAGLENDSVDGNGLGSDEERIYVASSKKNRFHRTSCEFAPCIMNSPNLIEFGSHREAREAGYKPCGQCKP